MPDPTTEFGRHADRRLRDEVIVWLTTVGDDHGPHPRPVWFLWDGRSLTIYSRENTWKLKHLTEHPRVSLNLNSDESGEDVIVLLGQAEILEGAPAADANEAYLRKYRQAIADLGMSPAEFAREYCVVIRVTPSKLRGA
jgi:PPOX class probable F420-dependent enzyme